MTGSDTLHFQIFGCVSRQLQHLVTKCLNRLSAAQHLHSPLQSGTPESQPSTRQLWLPLVRDSWFGSSGGGGYGPLGTVTPVRTFAGRTAAFSPEVQLVRSGTRLSPLPFLSLFLLFLRPVMQQRETRDRGHGLTIVADAGSSLGKRGSDASDAGSGDWSRVRALPARTWSSRCALLPPHSLLIRMLSRPPSSGANTLTPALNRAPSALHATLSSLKPDLNTQVCRTTAPYLLNNR